MGEEIKFTKEMKSVIDALMENSQEMIFVKNLEGIYTLASDSYARLLGFDSGREILGFDDFTLMKSEEAARICKENDYAVISKDMAVKDLTDAWKKTLFWMNRTLSTSKFPVHDEEGNVIGVLGITRDTTQENRARKTADQFRNAYDTALGARQAKAEFLMRMGRDIRNPLNVIMGLTTLAIGEAGEGSRVSEYLKQISISGKHLLGLVNDMLDMEKIESGQVELNVCDFDFSAFLENIYAMMRAGASEKNQTFVIDADVQHKMVVGDPTRVQQIFVNLISNSIRYSPIEGEINVSIKERDITDGVVTYEVCFSDNGIGIPDSYVKNAFAPLSKIADNSDEFDIGVAVGLAITKNLVNMMNGEISVSTKEGKGTSFFVTLSFPVSNSYSDDVQEGETDFTGFTALLVEDNDLSAEISKELLQVSGIKVERAENGRQGLDIFAASPENHFDIIFMDIQMPIMDGYEATTAIRKLNRADAAKVPIIAMTASALAQDIYNSKKAGMNEHLSKPVDFDVMCSTMSKYLKRK